MKLFRLKLKPGSGEEEKQLVLNTDAEAQAPAQGEALALQSDFLAQIDAEADREIEAEESTPAPELEDIPVQDLLTDLMGVCQSLGGTPRVPAEPGCDETLDAGAEPAEEEDATEPDGSQGPQVPAPSPTGYRRYALHGLLLSLALVAAFVGLVGAGRLARTALPESSPAQSQADHSRPPLIVATVPAAAEQEGQAETAAEPIPEPAPEPTPELQPAYFLYTVQPGDTISSIAGTFGISLDYVLWNNPDVIEDPNLLLVGEELLIPSVDGIIYRVKPGDTLSDIAALYRIEVESILAFAPNGLTSPDNAIAGMVLILPAAVPPSTSHISP